MTTAHKVRKNTEGRYEVVAPDGTVVTTRRAWGLATSAARVADAEAAKAEAARKADVQAAADAWTDRWTAPQHEGE